VARLMDIKIRHPQLKEHRNLAVPSRLSKKESISHGKKDVAGRAVQWQPITANLPADPLILSDKSLFEHSDSLAGDIPFTLPKFELDRQPIERAKQARDHLNDLDSYSKVTKERGVSKADKKVLRGRFSDKTGDTKAASTPMMSGGNTKQDSEQQRMAWQNQTSQLLLFIMSELKKLQNPPKLNDHRKHL
jgi:hypothetical protein